MSTITVVLVLCYVLGCVNALMPLQRFPTCLPSGGIARWTAFGLLANLVRQAVRGGALMTLGLTGLGIMMIELAVPMTAAATALIYGSIILSRARTRRAVEAGLLVVLRCLKLATAATAGALVVALIIAAVRDQAASYILTVSAFLVGAVLVDRVLATATEDVLSLSA